MSTPLLAILILLPTAAVVVAMFAVMWREATMPRSRSVAVAAGVVLAAWAAMTVIFARDGRYLPPDGNTPPAVAIQLVLAIVLMALCVALSPTLRGLLTNQKNLLRLNVWRLVGAVFVALMVTGQVPALWALPAGIGDVLVGLAAFPVANRVDRPGGRRLAVIFNLLGLADLVVAIGLGTATSPGPLHFLDTTPTAQLLTQFPLVLVPVFLVPLAFMVHFVSLWQLAGWPWVETISRRGISQPAVR